MVIPVWRRDNFSAVVVTKFHTKYGERMTIGCLFPWHDITTHVRTHDYFVTRAEPRTYTHICTYIRDASRENSSLYIRKRDLEDWHDRRIRFTYPIPEEVLDGTLRRVGEFHEDQGLVFVKITVRRQTILDTCHQRRHFSVSQQWVLSRTRPPRKSAHS